MPLTEGGLVTVVIVDDHAEFRRQMKGLLEAAGYDVIGEAADGAAAVATVLELRPALVLLDVQLPDMDGFEVAGRLAAQDTDAAVVMMSSRTANDYQAQLAANPAQRFISKADLSPAALAAVLAGPE